MSEKLGLGPNTIQKSDVYIIDYLDNIIDQY